MSLPLTGYNSGSNPWYANYPFNVPLYTICLGDTITKKDLELSSVSYNEIAYLGNSFPFYYGFISIFHGDIEGYL